MSKETSLRILLLLGLLYCFFLGLDLMGVAFKLFGKGLAERLIEMTSNPLVGLLIGVLATSAVQSSSTTTSITVAMVGAGGLTIEGAIPVIMGANIGTSVTNTLVSLAHVSRPEEFRRAFSGATLHDFFNWLAVLILLPVEMAFSYLARIAVFVEGLIEGVGGVNLFNPIKLVVHPVAEFSSELLGGSGLLTLALGIALIFLALRYLVTLLRLLLSARAEQILHGTLFRSAIFASMAGLLITVMVQSSSITTSLLIPLLGAGVITLEQAFPFTLGANVGTTVTAMMASLAIGSPAAIVVALAHLIFNLTGSALIYPFKPIRKIPLALARLMGDLAVRSRVLAVIYILAVFYGFPLAMLFLSGAF